MTPNRPPHTIQQEDMVMSGCRCYRVVAGLSLLATLILLTAAAPPPGQVPPAADPAKDAVLDGHVFHDAGRVLLHVTNWGLIGSWPGTTASFAWSPSARWPDMGGDDYLWAAGLWVGALQDGTPRVTTGQFEREYLPTSAPEDTIYSAGMGLPGGARYPDTDPDDDGDGLEDEDPPNGRDDDGDGLVDEDFGGIADQGFRCEYRDDDPRILEQSPDHVPLNLQVVQRSFQWSDPGNDAFVGFDFTIRNVGDEALEAVYVGFFADCDIHPADVVGGAEDDMAGSYRGPATASDGTVVPVSLAYMYDRAPNPLPGYIGVLFLDHTTDPSGATAPPGAELSSM